MMGRVVHSTPPHAQMTSVGFQFGKLKECPLARRRAVDTVEQEGWVGLVWSVVVHGWVVAIVWGDKEYVGVFVCHSRAHCAPNYNDWKCSCEEI